MKPNITTNGTDPKILYQGLSDLRQKLYEANLALTLAWPNGRDYVGDKAGFQKDVEQVTKWRDSLFLISDEALASMEIISDYVR